MCITVGSKGCWDLIRGLSTSYWENPRTSFFFPPLSIPIPRFSPPLKKTIKHENTKKPSNKNSEKNKTEIKDADEQACSLDQKAASALEACDGLERELSVATKDALRLQASLPGLDQEARETERQLATFR